MRTTLHGSIIVMFASVCLLLPQFSLSAPSADETLQAMHKATAFMMDTVSTHGGFVEKYTEDLSERWGEIPARNSMIWIQEPGTVSVGRICLETYKATGDERFLRYAERTANALIWGQHPSGGWHYLVDFEPEGLEKWYEEVAANCWGWEEFYHYYGNCTFDDNTTIGAAEFLLDLYMTTLDPEYRVPLLKAVDFVLESQYPLGGWPQRYPLRYDHGEEGHPDYTSFYTYNDGVNAGNIMFLLKCYEQLGNEEYKKAALRGMYFVVISQVGTPQAGWAQQYDLDLNPAGARSFEPKSIAPSTTSACILNLMNYYKITGDRRFLRGIPDALDWLENAPLPPGHAENRTHAQFVEEGTNKPLYAHREGTSRQDGRYWVDSEPGNFPGHYGMQINVDVEGMRKEYKRVFAMSPDEAMAEYAAEQAAQPAPPEASPETIQAMIDSMNERGAWIEDVTVKDYTDWKFKPQRTFKGINIRTYVNNMKTMLGYLQSMK